MNNEEGRRNSGRVFLVVVAVLVGILLVAALVGWYIRSQVVYTVAETEQVIVLRFGEVQAVITEPGQHSKAPMVDTVIYFPKGTLQSNPLTIPTIDRDGRQIVSNLVVYYRIIDPRQFRRTLQSQANARRRLGDIAAAALRAELANRSREEILIDPEVAPGTPGELNQEILESIRNSVQTAVDDTSMPFGVEISDVTTTATYQAN